MNPTRQKITYIPLDRATALSQGKDLEHEQTGTAMFADVSGFSRLAEALRRQLGDSKGAEMLITHLNQAFEALINAVHQYSGCVIGFSGDAITCWFDAKRHHGTAEAARSALMAAHDMHIALSRLATITLPDGGQIQLQMKITLASGVVQRWVLGVPEIQLIDALLGQPVDRLAAAEKLANTGEILADDETITYVQPFVEVLDTRFSEAVPAYFSVLRLVEPCAEPTPWAYLSDDALSDVELSRWLLPNVASHFNANISNLTELRRVVALFMRFRPAQGDRYAATEEQTNRFVQWAQRTIFSYGGNLLQLTFGDKGSYLYAAFGAPKSHENNAFRALSAALDLSQPPPQLGYLVQIGVSTGLMRVGFYGSSHRHTYGVQGDEVNIAARLMTHASEGQVLASEHVMKQVEGYFEFADQRGIEVKGQIIPVQAALMTGKANQTSDTIMMEQVTDTQSSVREGTWLKLYSAVSAAIKGTATNLIYLCSEAGMGKTYLTASVRKAIEREYDVLWMSAPCDEILNLPLAPFKFLVMRLFGTIEVFDKIYDEITEHVRTLATLDEEIRQRLLAQLGQNRLMLKGFVAPHEVQLADVSERTVNFNMLGRELLWLLRAFSLRQPIVLHLQDSQSLDSDSQWLAGELLKHNDVFPVTILLSSRYGSDGQIIRLPKKPDHTAEEVITLDPLTRQDVAKIITQFLAGEVHENVVTDIYQQSRGNPLYARLLITHLHDHQQVMLRDGLWRFTEAYDRTDLPVEIQTHLVAQIDRAGPKLKSVIQAAAVLGRTFDVNVLSAVLNDPAVLEQVIEGEAAGIWTQVTETRYEFAYGLLRSVAYSMLGQKRQIELHRTAVVAISEAYPDDPSLMTEIIAHMRVATQLESRLK